MKIQEQCSALNARKESAKGSEMNTVDVHVNQEGAWFITYTFKKTVTVPGLYDSCKTAYCALNGTHKQLVDLEQWINVRQKRLITISDLTMFEIYHSSGYRGKGLDRFYAEKEQAARIALDERSTKTDTHDDETILTRENDATDSRNSGSDEYRNSECDTSQIPRDTDCGTM